MTEKKPDTRQLLSDLARRYLESLYRGVPVPTSRVEKALIDADCPVYDVWLDFHENYAGYVEAIGNEGACWGLMHEKVVYALPTAVAGIVDAQYDSSDGLWYIYCADVHPSYEFMLDQNGHFQDGPTSSFNVYIEQQANWNHFWTSGGKPQMQFAMSQESIQQRVEDQATLVKSASDQYSEYWMGEHVLAVRDVETSRWLKTITR